MRVRVWQLTAENLSAEGRLEVMRNRKVLGAHRDDIYSSMTIFIVEGTAKDADNVRQAIYSRNAGAYCGLEEYVEEEIPQK